jgi:putative RecB family exonuclease
MELSILRRKPHLSASSIGTYVDCSLQYYFSYVQRLPMEFVSDALEFGSAIHLTLADFYRAKMVGDRMLLKDVHESYKQHWTNRVKDRSDIAYANQKDFQSYLIEGADLLTAWFNKLPDDSFEVIGVEEAFSFNLPGISAPIIGAIDLLESDESGALIITDFKTSARSYSVDEVDRNQQLTLYQMAMKRNGHVGHEILLKFDTLIKTKNPKCESYWTTRSETDEIRMERKIRQVWSGISKCVFVPNDTSWKCPRCHHRNVCDEWFLNGGGE